LLLLGPDLFRLVTYGATTAIEAGQLINAELDPPSGEFGSKSFWILPKNGDIDHGSMMVPRAREATVAYFTKPVSRSRFHEAGFTRPTG
jgi:hypothetical protein